MTTTRQKLQLLRQAMTERGLQAYLVPSTDPHRSEYVPSCWQRRQWVSGFTGSAGELVLTQSRAALWTDGRYFLQAGQQLKGSGITLMKDGLPKTPTMGVWLARQLEPGQLVGVDARLLTPGQADALQRELDPAGAKLKLLEGNLVDDIWSDQPAPSRAPIEVLAPRFAGESVKAKLRRLRKEMQQQGAVAHVLSTLDSIAWLFNIRSSDVDYNPVVIAYAVVEPERALLFTEPAKVSDRVRRALEPAVQLVPYRKIGGELSRLARERGRVWIDGAASSAWVVKKLARCQLVREPTPVARMKARKNKAELAGSRAAHRRDGVAMVRFLCWLEREVGSGEVTELTVADKLRELRSAGQHYRGESFGTIAGYGEHGAIIHYEATPETAATLRPEGILLVDSGAQYLDGTTDITRTVLLGGEATAEQRERYTRVLKGHIALARTRFPAGTAGRALDSFARGPLWEVGLNYNHGTGHGVGAYLSVHEGPQSISPVRCTGVPLEPGNILSNEPGHYEEGAYGIRLENLVTVVRDERASTRELEWLAFETITLCPFDLKLVERKLLEPEERAWVNAYHQVVRATLTPELEPAVARWLKRATKAI